MCGSLSQLLFPFRLSLCPLRLAVLPGRAQAPLHPRAVSAVEPILLGHGNQRFKLEGLGRSQGGQ